MTLNDEIEYMSHLEDKFVSCYKKIKFNQAEFYVDDELGAFRSNLDSGFDEPFKYIKVAGYIPHRIHEEIIEIITVYLDLGWKMPVEMRGYLSERFKKAVGPRRENLDSLFGLRRTEKNMEYYKNKEDAVYYIQFRRAMHKEIKPKDSKSSYYRMKSLNASLCDELRILFLKRIVTMENVKDLTKRGKQIGLTDNIREHYYQKDIECLIKYRDYLSGTITSEKNSEILAGMSHTLEWIEHKLEKFPFIKTRL